METNNDSYLLEEKRWRVDINDWHNTTVGLARFYFEQAEKELSFTERAFDSLTSRASTLVGILIPSIAGIIIYMLGVEKDKLGADDGVVMAVFVMTVPVVASILLLCTIFHPSKFRNVGSSPKSLIQQKFIKSEFGTEDLQVINIIYSECEAYQDRIDANDKLNKKLGYRFKLAIYTLATSPVFAILGYLLSKSL
jgi:hypothetical protein